MKRLLFGALCASILLVAAAVLPATSAGAAAPPAPGVPQNVAVVAGGHQVTITWSAPSSGPTPTSYRVTGTSAGSTCKAVTTTSCVLTFPANKPAKTSGQVVKYRVRAFNGTKAGPNSPQVSTVFGKPTVPASVVATAGNGSATISWSASTGSKYPVTGYTATASNASHCSTTTATTCTISGLTNGSTLTFSVVATNAVGSSAASASTAPLVVGAPLAPTGVSAVAGSSSASVSFTAPADNGSTIAYFTAVAHDLSNPGSPSDGFAWTGGASPVVVPSLQGGHTYRFTVTATNGRGEGASSAPSASVTLPGLPGAPTGLVATALTTSATVSFTAAADNGSAVTFYTLIAHDVSNPGSVTDGKVWGNNASPVPMPSLQAGHTYNFTAYASNGVGDGPMSSPSNSVTMPLAPDAPTALVATPGVNSVSVAFTAPDDHGSVITFYTITAHNISNPGGPGDGAVWGGSASPIGMSGLTSGETYNFTISAQNAVGTGPDSAPSNSVVIS